MIMVIGGSFQGKENFAKNELQIDFSFIDGENCSFGDIYECKGIKNFHLFVKRYLDREELISLAEDLNQRNPDLLIISDEVGYGIVPIDKTERLFREKTGRICCQLMQYTSVCYRVVAGIGVKIKG